MKTSKMFLAVVAVCALFLIGTVVLGVAAHHARSMVIDAPRVGRVVTEPESTRVGLAQERIRECLDGWDCSYMGEDVTYLMDRTKNVESVRIQCDEDRDEAQGDAKEWAEGFCDGKWGSQKQKDGLWNRTMQILP